jgi:hypothetical protein
MNFNTRMVIQEVNVDGVKAPYLVHFDGDVCDFYWKDAGGRLNLFNNAYANAERVKALWNMTSGVPTETLVGSWLMRLTLWVLRKLQ